MLVALSVGRSGACCVVAKVARKTCSHCCAISLQLAVRRAHIQHAGVGVRQREGTIPASPLPGNTPRLGGKDNKARVRDGREATWGGVSE